MRLNEIANPNFAPGMAYWISPRGEILDVAGSTHIAQVATHPEKFGFTPEKIQQIYDEHGEGDRVGSEGKAREEIMKSLFRRGWIRTRFYRQEYTWAVNIGKMTNKTYDLLKKWAQYHIGRDDVGKTAGKAADINLSIGWDENMTTKPSGSLKDYAAGEIAEAKNIFIEEDIQITIVESAADFQDPVLNEASIGRAYRHLQNDEIPVAFITAFRGGQENRDENIRRNKHLAAQVKKAGYGYFFVDGGWIENAGTPEEIAVEEDSIFIVGNRNDNGKLKGLVKKWMVQYDQDGVLLKPEGSKDVHLLLNNGEEINLGSFSIGRAAEGFSRIRGHEFHFESVRNPTKNWISNLAGK